LAITFLAPYDQSTPWSPEALGGTYRFLQRFWTLVDQYQASEPGEGDGTKLKQLINRVAKQVSKDLEHMSFNTAIAAMMEGLNDLYKLKVEDDFKAKDWAWALKTFTKLLAPFAPHITEEVWHRLNGEQSVHLERWPGFEERWLKQESTTIAVQINGKIRGQLNLAIGRNQAEVVAAAQEDPKIQPYIIGKQLKRTIYIPDKLLSLVV
jgi:leucyl-tRNA synthetase